MTISRSKTQLYYIHCYTIDHSLRSIMYSIWFFFRVIEFIDAIAGMGDNLCIL